MTQTPSRDWQKDMDFSNAAERWLDMIQGETTVFREYGPLENNEIAKFTNEADAIFFIEAREALPYWLKEAKVYKQSYEAVLRYAGIVEAREQQLKVAIECAIEEYGLWNDKSRAAEVIITELKRELSTLYPDTPAPTPEIIARPIEEWHEDMGCVIWWEFPISEPPHCGTPMDIDWPGYHTHWTPIVIPAAPKEGE